MKKRIPFQVKKLKYLLKGVATYLPRSLWRRLPAHQAQFTEKNLVRRDNDPTEMARTYYGVWLRFLVLLHRSGMRMSNIKSVAEIGPGDSMALGLAVLQCGVDRYYPIDVKDAAQNTDNSIIRSELEKLYRGHARIPNDDDLPKCHPRLGDYSFPDYALSMSKKPGFPDLRDGRIYFEEPTPQSVDLVISNAAMEHVDDVKNMYERTACWLKKGGYFLHVIGLNSHGTAPGWNGQYAMSPLEWRVIRGRCQYLINRVSNSEHKRLLKHYGFNILLEEQYMGRDVYGPGIKYKQVHRSLLKTTSPEDIEITSSVLVGYKRY